VGSQRSRRFTLPPHPLLRLWEWLEDSSVANKIAIYFSSIVKIFSAARTQTGVIRKRFVPLVSRLSHALPAVSNVSQGRHTPVVPRLSPRQIFHMSLIDQQ